MVERVLWHLEEMAIFARVGEIGSVSGAARALGIPKSSVSRAVAKLEAGYQARLVERTTRGLTLTEVGRALHARCLNLVAEARDAEAEIAAHQGHPSGRLRVAAPYAIGHMVLKPSLPDFLERFPDVDVQLQLTDRALNPVADGFDVVIRIGWLEDSDVIARKVADIDAVLVASRDYAARRGLPSSVEELGEHAIIGFPVEQRRVMTLAGGKERVTVPIWNRFACNDPLMNVDFVRRGIAIAPVSSFIAAAPLAAGELLQVLPKYTLLDQPAVHALYAGRTALSPKVSVFLDFFSELARRLREEPGSMRV